jgi:hypothetical protein
MLAHSTHHRHGQTRSRLSSVMLSEGWQIVCKVVILIFDTILNKSLIKSNMLLLTKYKVIDVCAGRTCLWEIYIRWKYLQHEWNRINTGLDKQKDDCCAMILKNVCSKTVETSFHSTLSVCVSATGVIVPGKLVNIKSPWQVLYCRWCSWYNHCKRIHEFWGVYSLACHNVQ